MNGVLYFFKSHIIFLKKYCSKTKGLVRVCQAVPLLEQFQNQCSSTNEYFIYGITKSGKIFRPSDWAERLTGVISCFAPRLTGGENSYLQYSPYVKQTLLGDTKCVILDSRLQDIEPLAFDFVMNFAKDNDLIVTKSYKLSNDLDK